MYTQSFTRTNIIVKTMYKLFTSGLTYFLFTLICFAKLVKRVTIVYDGSSFKTHVVPLGIAQFVSPTVKSKS